MSFLYHTLAQGWFPEQNLIILTPRLLPQLIFVVC